MGLLDDYTIDLNDAETSSFEIPDNFYDFVIGDFFLRNGTQNKPDSAFIVIDYSCEDETGKVRSKQEWFELPVDGANQTDKEMQRMGFLKTRLLDLGASPAQLADLDPEDFIGKGGTLEIFTNKAGYQNIRKVRIGDEAEAPKAAEPEEAAAPEAAAPKAKAVRVASAPVVEAKAAAAGVKKNPFAKAG